MKFFNKKSKTKEETEDEKCSTIRKYKIDENGKEYEVEEKLKPLKFDLDEAKKVLENKKKTLEEK